MSTETGEGRGELTRGDVEEAVLPKEDVPPIVVGKGAGVSHDAP